MTTSGLQGATRGQQNTSRLLLSRTTPDIQNILRHYQERWPIVVGRARLEPCWLRSRPPYICLVNYVVESWLGEGKVCIVYTEKSGRTEKALSQSPVWLLSASFQLQCTLVLLFHLHFLFVITFIFHLSWGGVGLTCFILIFVTCKQRRPQYNIHIWITEFRNPTSPLPPELN